MFQDIRFNVVGYVDRRSAALKASYEIIEVKRAEWMVRQICVGLRFASKELSTLDALVRG